jgi:hypothetical protein
MSKIAASAAQEITALIRGGARAKEKRREWDMGCSLGPSEATLTSFCCRCAKNNEPEELLASYVGRVAKFAI